MSHELTVYFLVFWPMKWLYFQKYASQITLNHTTIYHLPLPLFEVFFSLLSLDVNFSVNQSLLIFLLCVRQTWKTQLILSFFLFEGLSSIKWKGIKYLYAWSCSLCEGGTSFCTRLFSKKLWRFLFLTGFTLFYILLFFSYGLLYLSLYTVFVTISNIDEVISINPSANVLVLGDFNIHYKDWLTYYGGTYRPGELCHQLFQHRWLTFLLVSLTLILSLALLDLFISCDPNTYSAVALGMTLKVWWVFLSL